MRKELQEFFKVDWKDPIDKIKEGEKDER